MSNAIRIFSLSFSRVRELFEYYDEDEHDETKNPQDDKQEDSKARKPKNPRFKFNAFIERADMKVNVFLEIIIYVWRYFEKVS